jgi:myb proto-oncogene protein
MQPKKWTSSELNSLVQAVRQQCQQILVNQLYERYRHPDAGSLEDFNREMARIRNMSEYELEVYVNGIDWELVARTCLPHRTAEECRLKWLRHTSPLINRSAWSPEEDTALLQLVQCHGATHWEFIAQQLGTRRTPAQCFMRFQRSLNNKIVNSKWTEDEDRLLIQAVKKYGEKNWQQGSYSSLPSTLRILSLSLSHTHSLTNINFFG